MVTKSLAGVKEKILGLVRVLGAWNERRALKFEINAHDDDVNAVVFADDSSHILFSGSDDGICKVWNRRTLSESNPQPVGVLAGHLDGITFIDSKGDGRYLISNSKDQSIKLWDMRWLSSEDAQNETKLAVARQNWDYRWLKVPKPGKFDIRSSVFHSLFDRHWNLVNRGGLAAKRTDSALSAAELQILETLNCTTALEEAYINSKPASCVTQQHEQINGTH